MRDTIKIIGGIIVAVLMLDAFGFMAWALSDQYPVDNFYIGAITANILRAVLF